MKKIALLISLLSFAALASAGSACPCSQKKSQKQDTETQDESSLVLQVDATVL